MARGKAARTKNGSDEIIFDMVKMKLLTVGWSGRLYKIGRPNHTIMVRLRHVWTARPGRPSHAGRRVPRNSHNIIQIVRRVQGGRRAGRSLTCFHVSLTRDPMPGCDATEYREL